MRSSPAFVAASGSDAKRAQSGSAAIPTVVAVGFLLLLLTLFTQFAVWQYGRGAVRAAAQAGARQAAVLDAEAGACEAAFAEVRDQLLGGSLGSGVGGPRCEVGAEVVTVTSEVRFERWLPVSPDWEFQIVATAVREREPQ